MFVDTDCREKWITESNKNLDGNYIPQCTVDGAWKAVQCHGSTGECWCVHKDGSEVEGTRKKGEPALESCKHRRFHNYENYYHFAKTIFWKMYK